MGEIMCFVARTNKIVSDMTEQCAASHLAQEGHALGGKFLPSHHHLREVHPGIFRVSQYQS